MIAVVVVLLGLASRRYPGALPSAFGKYPGDVLWAVMAFVIWSGIRARASSTSVAATALATCVVIELLKLYQAPWIVQLRHTTIGHLVFGHVFSFENLLAYALGVAMAWAVDALAFSPQVRRLPIANPGTRLN